MTAAVKIYFKSSNDPKPVVMKHLKYFTECNNPDVRDKATIYYRLLFDYPDATKVIKFLTIEYCLK